MTVCTAGAPRASSPFFVSETAGADGVGVGVLEGSAVGSGVGPAVGSGSVVGPGSGVGVGSGSAVGSGLGSADGSGACVGSVEEPGTGSAAGGSVGAVGSLVVSVVAAASVVDELWDEPGAISAPTAGPTAPNPMMTAVAMATAFIRTSERMMMKPPRVAGDVGEHRALIAVYDPLARHGEAPFRALSRPAGVSHAAEAARSA
ncbi:hypothetical protein ASC59_06645 [Leifsonia sp. Root1293]|nr:hypothetical protein ASC59_06645 [Leifsonia sp. Root1293]KRA11718.1 hypothetical protein ASD61_06645 [Leifsonia sp. Root60]